MRARSQRSGSAEAARVAASAHTGGKTDSARQTGPARSASGRGQLPPPRRRWVPPSSLRHHEVPDGDAKHDIIFRKVCYRRIDRVLYFDRRTTRQRR